MEMTEKKKKYEAYRMTPSSVIRTLRTPTPKKMTGKL